MIFSLVSTGIKTTFGQNRLSTNINGFFGKYSKLVLVHLNFKPIIIFFLIR